MALIDDDKVPEAAFTTAVAKWMRTEGSRIASEIAAAKEYWRRHSKLLPHDHIRPAILRAAARLEGVLGFHLGRRLNKMADEVVRTLGLGEGLDDALETYRYRAGSIAYSHSEKCEEAFQQFLGSNQRGWPRWERKVSHDDFLDVRERLRTTRDSILTAAREEFRSTGWAERKERPLYGPLTGNDGRTDRQQAVDAYIAEVAKIRNRRITRADIWKAARYKSRTEFERWEHYWLENRGEKGNKSADQKFTRLLTEKPHLKNPSPS